MFDSMIQQAVQWFSDVATGAGQAIGRLTEIPGLNNPFVRRLASVLRLDWLLGMTNRVDADRVQATVRSLQQQYPQESRSEIAHRLMALLHE
jgi:hypothetical protein